MSTEETEDAALVDANHSEESEKGDESDADDADTAEEGLEKDTKVVRTAQHYVKTYRENQQKKLPGIKNSFKSLHQNTQSF